MLFEMPPPDPAAPEKPAHPKLTLRYPSGVIRDVVEYRRDGWPICPVCNEDELGAVHTMEPRADLVDICYRCGRVEVITR